MLGGMRRSTDLTGKEFDWKSLLEHRGKGLSKAESQKRILTLLQRVKVNEGEQVTFAKRASRLITG